MRFGTQAFPYGIYEERRRVRAQPGRQRSRPTPIAAARAFATTEKPQNLGEIQPGSLGTLNHHDICGLNGWGECVCRPACLLQLPALKETLAAAVARPEGRCWSTAQTRRPPARVKDFVKRLPPVPTGANLLPLFHRQPASTPVFYLRGMRCSDLRTPRLDR